MKLDLPDSIHKIFEQVKSLTGKDILLVERKDLDTYASVKIARKGMPNHLMYYKPEHTGMINHLIAHECGHILRIYGVKPEHRLIPFSNDQLKLKALEDIEPEIERLSKMMSFEGVVQIANMWYAGLIKQLTNFPSDMMIEKRIYDEYPDLRLFQSQYMKKQYGEAVQSLSSKVARMSPQKILRASNGMNYAFFCTLGTHFGDSDYLRRWQRSDYANIGKELMRLRQESENSYKGDIDTVNKWAAALGLSHWFAWTDFENVPKGYEEML